MAYHSCISDNTVSYLTQQFPAETPAWLAAFPGELKRICEKWAFTPEGHEPCSRFGAILYGASARYGRVAVKVVPWFSPRLKTEVFCYRHLPYREMCPLYDVDEKLGAMLLRYVPAANSADHAPRERVFRSLYEQRRPAAPDETALPRYEDVLGDVLSNARAAVTAKNDARLMPFLPSIERALNAMETFRDSERYLIHGDAHEYNMLVEYGGCVLIDPLGYVAPIEFEFARYLGTAMKKHPLSNAEMDALVSRILPGGVDRARALSAFAIDTTLRGCNTFIEGNTCEEIVFGASWAARAWNYADALSQPAKEGKRHVS